MSIPRYLERLRAAVPQTYEKNERNEQREQREPGHGASFVNFVSFVTRSFSPGSRYVMDDLRRVRILGDVPGFVRWREASECPRAGIISIDGEIVLVADVVELLFKGTFDVLGVPPVNEDEPEEGAGAFHDGDVGA